MTTGLASRESRWHSALSRRRRVAALLDPVWDAGHGPVGFEHCFLTRKAMDNSDKERQPGNEERSSANAEQATSAPTQEDIREAVVYFLQLALEWEGDDDEKPPELELARKGKTASTLQQVTTLLLEHKRARLESVQEARLAWVARHAAQLVKAHKTNADRETFVRDASAELAAVAKYWGTPYDASDFEGVLRKVLDTRGGDTRTNRGRPSLVYEEMSRLRAANGNVTRASKGPTTLRHSGEKQASRQADALAQLQDDPPGLSYLLPYLLKAMGIADKDFAIRLLDAWESILDERMQTMVENFRDGLRKK